MNLSFLFRTMGICRGPPALMDQFRIESKILNFKFKKSITIHFKVITVLIQTFVTASTVVTSFLEHIVRESIFKSQNALCSTYFGLRKLYKFERSNVLSLLLCNWLSRIWRLRQSNSKHAIQCDKKKTKSSTKRNT